MSICEDWNQPLPPPWPNVAREIEEALRILRERAVVAEALDEVCYICGSTPGHPTPKKFICSRCGCSP